MAEEEAEESGGGGGGGKKKLLFIIIIALILLGIIGGGLYWFMGSDDEEEMGKKGTSSAEMEADARMDEEISARSQKETIKLTDPKYTPKKNYTVNLRDGKHFLQIELVAALEDEKALEYLVQREPVIDDMIISFLQNLRTEDLRKRTGFELLKRELYKKINSIFSQEFIEDSETQDRTPVKKILITKFILN